MGILFRRVTTVRGYELSIRKADAEMIEVESA